MSFEDYLKSDMRKAVDKLEKIISKSVIDWDLFDHTLTGLPDINTRHEEDTILSELYYYCPDGTVLIEITKRFLANGYDVRANDGLNGSQCLHSQIKDKETIERVFADAREKHAMRYTHHRGLGRVKSWVRHQYAAMNLKQLAEWSWNNSFFVSFLSFFPCLCRNPHFR